MVAQGIPLAQSYAEYAALPETVFVYYHLARAKLEEVRGVKPNTRAPARSA